VSAASSLKRKHPPIFVSTFFLTRYSAAEWKSHDANPTAASSYNGPEAASSDNEPQYKYAQIDSRLCIQLSSAQRKERDHLLKQFRDAMSANNYKPRTTGLYVSVLTRLVDKVSERELREPRFLAALRSDPFNKRHTRSASAAVKFLQENCVPTRTSGISYAIGAVTGSQF
jgi:hypothetical protein